MKEEQQKEMRKYQSQEEAFKKKLMEQSREIKQNQATQDSIKKAILVYFEKNDETAISALCNVLRLTEEERKRMTKKKSWF